MALTALAASAVQVFGACGDDDEEATGGETGGETTALAKAAYIEPYAEFERLAGQFGIEGHCSEAGR